MRKVFVYGSLMRGLGNSGRMIGAEFLGEARTEPGFFLTSLGYFPAMHRGGERSVLGEVYLADDKTMLALDRLEGHPRFYRRTVIRLADGSEVETYLMSGQGYGDELPVDSWRDWFEKSDEFVSS